MRRADSISALVALYAPPDVASLISAASGRPKIEFLDYDWALNSAEMSRK